MAQLTNTSAPQIFRNATMTCQVSISGMNVKGSYISGTAVDVTVAFEATNDINWMGTPPETKVEQVKVKNAKLTVGGNVLYNHPYEDVGPPASVPDPDPVQFLIEGQRYSAKFASTKFSHGATVPVVFEVQLVCVYKDGQNYVESGVITLTATISPEVYNRYVGWRLRADSSLARAQYLALEADFQAAATHMRDHFVGAGYLFEPGIPNPFFRNKTEIINRIHTAQASGFLAHGVATGPEDTFGTLIPWADFTRDLSVPNGNISIAYSCSLLTAVAQWQEKFGMGTPFALNGFLKKAAIEPLANPNSSFARHAQVLTQHLEDGYTIGYARSRANALSDIYDAQYILFQFVDLDMELGGGNADDLQTTKWVYLNQYERALVPATLVPGGLTVDKPFKKWFYVFGLDLAE